MDRYRRRIAMLSVGAQLGCPVRRRIEGEIEIARPVDLRLLRITLKSMTFTDEMQPAEQTQQGGRRPTVGQVQEDQQRPIPLSPQPGRRTPHRRTGVSGILPAPTRTVFRNHAVTYATGRGLSAA